MPKQILFIACLILFQCLVQQTALAQFPNPDLLIAEEMRNKGDYDGAIAIYTKALTLGDDKAKADIYSLRAQTYYYKRDFDRVIQDCTVAIQLDPNQVRAYTVRGETMRMKGNYSQAIDDLNKAIQIDPSADNFALRAGSLNSAQRYAEALADINKALELRPEAASMIASRGYIYEKKGDLDLALADYSKSIELNPYSALSFLNRANLYRKMRRFDLAIADSTKVIELKPGIPDGYVLRGNVYKQQGLDDLALVDLEKGLQIDARFRDAYFFRGQIYSSKGRYEEAISDFNKTAEYFPNFIGVFYSRSWANLYANRGNAAYQDAELFLEKNGSRTDPGPYAVLVGYLGLRKSNKAADAKAFLTKWLATADADAWPTKIVHYFQGDTNSDQLLTQAVDNDKLTEAHAYIGEMQLLSGDTKAAATHFNWVRINGKKTFSEYFLAIAELNRINALNHPPARS